MKSRSTTKPEITARVVCEKACNNGWMSVLEDRMKQVTEDILLKNKTKTFSPQDCATIAAWAFKTTVLANHIRPTGDPFFTAAERRAFAKDLSIPKGVQVWIAQRNAGGYLTGMYRSIQHVKQPQMPIMPHLVNPPVSPRRFKIYTCTFNVGFLILQVLANRWTEQEARDTLAPLSVSQSKAFEVHATPIWPNDGFSVAWPPPLPVDNALIEIFWNRFENLGLTI